MVCVVDYGMGNLRSVEKAIERLGYDVTVSRDADVIAASDVLVLPGVGSFGDSMRNLDRYGLIEPLLEHLRGGKPFLGICLGLQVLFEGSEESPGVEGLGVLRGKVVGFRRGGPASRPRLKVPHMGWNTVQLAGSTPLFDGIPAGSRFYFVHSYYASPEDESVVLGRTTYGVTFASVLKWRNVVAVQFHPEKSGTLGLRFLDNYCRLSGQRRRPAAAAGRGN